MEKFPWHTHRTIYIFNSIFQFTILLFTPYILIAFFEPLESIDIYQKCLMGPDGFVRRWKIVLFRIIGCCAIMSLTLISNNIAIISEFTGTFFMPIVGLFFPIILVHSKALLVDKKRKSISVMIHDLIILLFSTFIFLYGAFHQIWKLATED